MNPYDHPAGQWSGDRRLVGKATVWALTVVAVLFIVQTCVAALPVPGKTEFAGDDATNSAFYDIAEIAGGHWLKTTVAIAAALATGVANSLVAQAATSRLLFSMARDRKLPAFLGHVHPGREVPERAIPQPQPPLGLHIVAPLIGFLIIGSVLWNMDTTARISGVIWLVIGGCASSGGQLGRRSTADDAADLDFSRLNPVTGPIRSTAPNPATPW